MTWTIPTERMHGASYAVLSDPRPMVERLKDVFGLRALAEIVNIDPSSLSQFLGGRRSLPSELLHRFSDVYYVLSRAAQVMDAKVIEDWLVGIDPALGARPIDVLSVRGAAPLIMVLDRIEAGAYA